MKLERLQTVVFWLAIALIVYMPLHVFIVQSASLITGGLEVWKAAKDILLFVAIPLLLYLAYRQKLFEDKTFRTIIILSGLYSALHLLFVLFDQNDDTYSAIVASVYNVRLLGFLLLGLAVGSAKNGRKYLKYILTAAVIIAGLVALFAVAQYFLPKDLLESVGYSLERGVKPMFFIDDRVELPRVMSTLKDPNSLGAYLILPILLVATALFKPKFNAIQFTRPFRKEVLLGMLIFMLLALFLTFSRGALVGLILSAATLLLLQYRKMALRYIRRFWLVGVIGLIVVAGVIVANRENQFVQDYIIHAAVSSEEADPNAKRLDLYEEAVEGIVDEPQGYGPGTAGIVSINNPKGTVLTENYYLQIAYEVGWLGLAVFVAILTVLIMSLLQIIKQSIQARILLSAMVGYLFYSLLIHLWSNETVALQWWLLCGVVLGVGYKKTQQDSSKNKQVS